jgi:hypothetical protein
VVKDAAFHGGGGGGVDRAIRLAFPGDGGSASVLARKLATPTLAVRGRPRPRSIPTFSQISALKKGFILAHMVTGSVGSKEQQHQIRSLFDLYFSHSMIARQSGQHSLFRL